MITFICALTEAVSVKTSSPVYLVAGAGCEQDFVSPGGNMGPFTWQPCPPKAGSKAQDLFIHFWMLWIMKAMGFLAQDSAFLEC